MVGFASTWNRSKRSESSKWSKHCVNMRWLLMLREIHLRRRFRVYWTSCRQSYTALLFHFYFGVASLRTLTDKNINIKISIIIVFFGNIWVSLRSFSVRFLFYKRMSVMSKCFCVILHMQSTVVWCKWFSSQYILRHDLNEALQVQFLLLFALTGFSVRLISN